MHDATTPQDETPQQRRKRLRKERNRRWYAAHSAALKQAREARRVLIKTVSDAPNRKTRRIAVAELSRMGIDPEEAAQLNDLERVVDQLKNWVTDLSGKVRAVEARVIAPTGPDWQVGDRVLVPVPLLQSVNRRAASATLHAMCVGEVVVTNQAQKVATVRVGPDQAVSVRFDQIIPWRKRR